MFKFDKLIELYKRSVRNIPLELYKSNNPYKDICDYQIKLMHVIRGLYNIKKSIILNSKL